MMRFQLLVYYTGLDGNNHFTKHEFDAVDLAQAVSIGRNIVESIRINGFRPDTVNGFTVNSLK